jgi:Carboxypeptidase regulatory-like domain
MNLVITLCKRSWGARSRSAVQLLGGVFAIFLLCLPAFSQGSFGRILGTVTDQSGGVVAGATVTVVDTERGTTRTLTTDDAGAYNAPNLTPGNYTVRVEAKGFKKIERQAVGIEVGHEVRVDLTVQPGEQTQIVTVTESVPLVETTNATMGGTLENADIVDLPLNGRDYQNLLGLRPGVLLMVGGGPWTQSTNGVRPDESVWMIDGVFNANPFDARPVVNMPSPFTDGATIMPVDAIQEFNVMENPKAEYGWKPGAVVNVGIKSGTNQLHGSAYAFGRYDGWDARNFYNISLDGKGNCAIGLPITCAKVPAQLKQFGGVVGGPIMKDKLFFFAGYEGLRSTIAPAAGVSAPETTGQTPADPGNSTVDAINQANTLGPVSKASLSIICPNAIGQALPLASSFACNSPLLPIANATGIGTISNFPISNVSDNGVGKLDWHPNSKNAVSGVFFLGYYTAFGEDHGFTSTAFNDSVPIRAWTVTPAWVYTPNSTVVNELRFGYTRTTFDFINQDVNQIQNGSAKEDLLNTGITDPLVGGLPNIFVGGFGCGCAGLFGTATNRPQYFTPNPTYDLLDSISVLKGKHTFKFGGEFAHMEADNVIYNQGRGLFNFPSLLSFIQGAPASAAVLAGNPAVKLTWMNASGFIQDDWRITSKLIINLGVRYEYLTPMKEANNLWGDFDPNLGMVQQGHGIDSVWKGDHRDFEPRIGFAYDLNGKGTTVIRAGGSILHAAFNGADFMGAFGLEDDVSTSPGAIPTGAPIFCNGGAALGESACPASAGGSINTGVVNFANPSVLCWDPALASCPAGQKTVFPSVSVKCGDGFAGAPGPCDLMAVDPNLRAPYVINYNLSVQHQFGANLSLEVAYVGNRGGRLLSFTNENEAPLGAAYCLNALTTAQMADACKGGALPAGSASAQSILESRPFFSKFPYIGVINDVSNKGHSNYNSLQVTLTQRASHGLSFTAGYTLGHALDNGSLNRFGGLPQDSNNLAGNYANGDLDARHRLSVTATYDIPGPKGYGQLLEGWEINAIVSYQSPMVWNAADGLKPGPPGNDFSGTGDLTDRWNITGPASSMPSGKASFPYCTGFGVAGGVATTGAVTCNFANAYNPGGGVLLSSAAASADATACAADAVDPTTLAVGGCYASPDGKTFLTPNALGHFGDMGRNIFRDSGFKNLDMSIFKNFKFRERYAIQARWEVFNVFNHPVAANPYGAGGFVNTGNELSGPPFGSALATPDFIAGNPLIGSGSQRVMQVGLKLSF